MPEVKMRAHPRHTGLHGYMPSARPHTLTPRDTDVYSGTHPPLLLVLRGWRRRRRKQPQRSVIFRCRFVVVFVCVSTASAKLGVECWIALATQPLMMKPITELNRFKTVRELPEGPQGPQLATRLYQSHLHSSKPSPWK